MKIYDAEINDGVADLVKSSASIAYCSPAAISENPNPQGPTEESEVFKSLADSNPDQIALYYLDSVLVSTGWNKNDDVFLS